MSSMRQCHIYRGIVILVSYGGGLGAGMLASVLAVAASDRLAAMSGGAALTLRRRDEVIDLATFLLVSALVGYLVAREARQARQARRADRWAADVDAIVQSLTDAVLVIGPRGDVVKVNTAALRLLGLERPEEALIPLADLALRHGLYPLPHGEHAASEEPLSSLIGRPFRDKHYVVARGDRRRAWVILNGAPLLDADGALLGSIIVAHDITALKEAEQQRDEFLALTSHELKTPATALKGYAQLAGRTLQKGDTRLLAASLRRLEESADRLVALVDRLVEFARLSFEPPYLVQEELDLFAHVRGVAASMASAAASHHVSVEAHGDEPLRCRGDGRKLAQALGQLVRNALWYSPAGTTITLSLTRTGDTALLAVRDEGIGIPADEQERVFQPFTRGSNADTSHAGGLGIGLYVSRRIIEEHGGRLWLDSTEGEGTTVYVTLPLYAPAAA
jgi:PAS domain S-box-containing protein